MLITGEWAVGDDGISRPVIRGEVQTASGEWIAVPFLVDTGADRTVFSADVLKDLGLPPLVTPDRLEGVGGRAASVVVETRIRLLREDNTMVLFRGQYAALTDADALDMSVLGRDVLNFFAVIVDRPQNVVCLLCQKHSYTIAQS